MFLHLPDIRKPNLGEAAAEPHSVLLEEVHLVKILENKPYLGAN
jgi:hypothetical protein